MIEINIDDEAFNSAFRRLTSGVVSASPLMQVLAGDMMDEVEENFAQQGRPKWLGFKHTPSKKRGGTSARLLQDTGQLASSITPSSDSNSAKVSTNKEYAAIHQFGGNAGRGKTAKIPARPYLSVTPLGEQKILSHTSQYLTNLIK